MADADINTSANLLKDLEYALQRLLKTLLEVDNAIFTVRQLSFTMNEICKELEKRK